MYYVIQISPFVHALPHQTSHVQYLRNCLLLLGSLPDASVHCITLHHCFHEQYDEKVRVQDVLPNTDST